MVSKSGLKKREGMMDNDSGNNVKQRNEDESQEMIYKVNSGGNKRLVSLTEECWWSTEIKSEQFMNIVG